MAVVLLVAACAPSGSAPPAVDGSSTSESPIPATFPAASSVTTTPATDALFPSGAVDIAGVELKVWFADDGSERRQGLMDIEALPLEIDGMLFVFPEPRHVGFHMRNTLIPLDIWWFDQEMELVGTAEMEPCTGEPCVSYPSPVEVQWVLETPLGDHDFETGSRISIVEKP